MNPNDFQEQVILCAGCGSLGSAIALHLAQPGRSFILIDDDVVEENNLATSAYHVAHVTQRKTNALADLLYRKARCEVVLILNDTQSDHISRHPRLRREKIDLIIDAFDNSRARGYTHNVNLAGRPIPVLHVGVSANHTGAIEWDECYTVPESILRGDNQVCTHNLGNRILRFTAAVAAGVIEEFLTTGVKRNLYVTEDMQVTG